MNTCDHRAGTSFHATNAHPLVKARALLAAVALVAAGLPGTCMSAEEPASADKKAQQVKRTVLRRIDVPDANYEVVIVRVDAPAGASAGRHTHPGTVFGYVLEGDYTMLIEGKPPQAFERGESLEVPSGAVHDERAGKAGARLLAVFTVEKGKPLASPAP